MSSADGQPLTCNVQAGRLAHVCESPYELRHSCESGSHCNVKGWQRDGKGVKSKESACRWKTFSRYILKSTRKLFSTLQICRKHPRSKSVVRGIASAAVLHLYLDVLLHRAVSVNDNCEKEVKHAPEPLG